jgi:hypothetical protein
LFAAFLGSSSEGYWAFASRFDDRATAQVSDIVFQRQAPSFAKLFFGSDDWLGAVVNLADWLGWLFVVVFPIAYAYDGGWRRTVGLVLFAVVAFTLYGVCTVLLGVDEPGRIEVIGTLATILTLALMVALSFQVTWFGLRSGSSA